MRADLTLSAIPCYLWGLVNERLRVSFIKFLNALPLGWGFLHGSQKGVFELLFDVPSECARRLEEGEAHIGLIPVIEYLRIPGLKVIPDIAIASRKQVRSVLFASRIPIEEVSRVAVDTSSRTSVALLQILLNRFYGLKQVKIYSRSPDPGMMLQEADAALLIGNPALNWNLDGLYVYDLALEWNKFTGLPFVFAFWAVREDIRLGKLVESFLRSREEGLESIGLISQLYASKMGLSAAQIESYLLSNLDYSLDESNLEGLQMFFRLAKELNLVEQTYPIRLAR